MSQWIENIFAAKIATEDGIVRRKKASVERYASRAELIAAAKKRNFHLIETGDQFVIVRNTGAVKIIT